MYLRKSNLLLWTVDVIASTSTNSPRWYSDFRNVVERKMMKRCTNEGNKLIAKSEPMERYMLKTICIAFVEEGYYK